jgi:hypothetical protein
LTRRHWLLLPPPARRPTQDTEKLLAESTRDVAAAQHAIGALKEQLAAREASLERFRCACGGFCFVFSFCPPRLRRSSLGRR